MIPRKGTAFPLIGRHSRKSCWRSAGKAELFRTPSGEAEELRQNREKLWRLFRQGPRFPVRKNGSQLRAPIASTLVQNGVFVALRYSSEM